MPKRPPTSGYARIAQAEEEQLLHESDEEDDVYKPQTTLSTPGTQYAPIQSRRDRMRDSGAASPTQTRRPRRNRRQRSNSGVDIKAINARLERWADEIASKFKRRRRGKSRDDEQLEIHHSVFQAPEGIRPATAETLVSDYADAVGSRMTKAEFDDIVESVRVAIELGTHPKLISQGSSGSYFARDTQGKTVGVFKPKDEEPYASRNPKWTKWIHRNLFPFFFGRACLIPNLSYVSEAAAYVLDTQLRTNLVPYTGIVSLSSKSFYYDFWDRRAYYRKKKPFPEKVGSFQIFLKGFKDANLFLKEHPWPDQHNSGFRAEDAPKRKRRRWAEDCRPGGAASDDEDEHENTRPNTAEETQRRRVFWSDALQQSFREQLEKLVILDYIMRNTDRGLDNWMIRIDTGTDKATIVAEPPKNDEQLNGNVPEHENRRPSPRHPSHTRVSSQPTNRISSSSADITPYKREEPMVASSRSTTPAMSDHAPAQISAKIGAIDNSLSWPWKHPDAWRSYPFGWLFLPVSLIGQPFTEATRRHFLPLLTSKQWWMETQAALRHCFMQDDDFKEKMYARQIAVMKGQAWNVVETLKTPDHGPLELTRRARVCVWDDVVDIPVAVPLRAPSAEVRRREAEARPSAEVEEMDISTALRNHSTSAPIQPQEDLVALGSPPLSKITDPNRFNLSRQSSTMDVNRPSEETPLSPATVQAISWSSPPRKERPSRDYFAHNSRMSYDGVPASAYRRESPDERRRRFSFSARRNNSHLGVMGVDEEDEGDLGYAAAEDMEGMRRKVVVERLETVKSKNPVFTWC